MGLLRTLKVGRTPGPWRAQRWFVGQPSAKIFDPKGGVVAVVFNLREEGPRNQLLMTAASDLEDACAQLLWALDGGDAAELENGKTAARAALKKAKGGRDE